MFKSMNHKQVTRWKNGVPVTVVAEPMPFNSARAKQILRDNIASDFDSRMMDSEIAYTRRVWEFMDGSSSFYSALCAIANDTMPAGFHLECDKCASADSGHNVHCPNAGRIDWIGKRIVARNCSTCSKPFTPETDGVYECSTGCYYTQHGLWGWD